MMRQTLPLMRGAMRGRAAGCAQQVTGTPGSPGATTTIDGRYLPPPPQPFEGEINPNAAQSMPSWPALVVPPKGAPNILLIMTDDVGFSAPSTFGGVIPTPTLDRVANMGLRYTRFHTTALCSPTRAALLTGHNHHSVATGVVVDQATGYPGYDSVIPRDAVGIGEILRLNGYDTSWYGKDHNTPNWVASQAGPFTDWPTGPIKGFDYYYGFIGDDTSQWQPNNLFRNTTPIEPYLGHPGWNLITAMADEAIARIRMLHEVQPDRPFMIYYAPGGTHAPHHPTKEWVDKISAMHLFDQGWNKLRDTIFANQKRLGVIPADAKLTAWPKDLPQWDTLSQEEKKLYIRQADVYAAYLAYTDHEIGRVIQAIEDAGKLDNTLIIYISGDNGASPEGTLDGLYSEFAILNGIHPTVAENMKFYDAWGTDQTYPHYAVPWAWALDTPYQWTKEVASHFGGIRNGMAMAWPARIKDKGGIRNQFHHVIDIVPTILEAAGLPQPVSVNGIIQRPIEGVSMTYTWDKDGADAPDRRVTQYFEMFGSRAIYHDGWIASAPPVVAPWVPLAEATAHRRDERLPVAALRPQEGLDAGRRPCGPDAGQAARHGAAVHPGGGEIPGLPARRPYPTPVRRTEAELHPRPDRVHLFGRVDRRAVPRGGRRAERAEQVVHDHGRGRHPPGRRRGHAGDRRRPLCRLRSLPAEGPAGLHLEPVTTGAGEVAGQRGAGTRQAHARV